jgi:hypothetical protein
MHHHSAVDHDALTCNEAGIIGGKERHHIGDILRLADAAKCGTTGVIGHRIGIAVEHWPGHAGFDCAGLYAIDGNAMWSQFHCERAGQPQYGMFRSGVGDKACITIA